MVEQQTPNLRVGGSNPSWPAKLKIEIYFESRGLCTYEKYRFFFSRSEKRAF